MRLDRGFRLVRKKGLTFWEITPFRRLGCRAVFFLRTGGVSQGRFRGLNLGMNTDDDPLQVQQNRQRAYSLAGLGPLLPVCAQQVHQARAQWAEVRHAGKGWLDAGTAFRTTDALMTRVPGLPLSVSIADCLPILFVSPTPRAVAAIHAGWRGIANQIIPKTLRKMQRELKFSPEKCWAAIGPGIGPLHFEVQGEALERLSRRHPLAVVRRTPKGSAYFDLSAAAREQLLGFGLPRAQIICLHEDTAAFPKRYFSYRRDGETGRTLGMIQIEIKKRARPA